MKGITFTKKLSLNLLNLAGKMKCDRIAILNPYSFKVLRVVNASTKSIINHEKSTVEYFLNKDEHNNLVFKWNYGYYKSTYREYMISKCAPIHKKDGDSDGLTKYKMGIETYIPQW